jgi:chromosome segregation ATPase
MNTHQTIARITEELTALIGTDNDAKRLISEQIVPLVSDLSIGEMEDTMSELNGEVESLWERLERATKSIEELESELDDREDTISNMEKQISDLEDKVRDLGEILEGGK